MLNFEPLHRPTSSKGEPGTNAPGSADLSVEVQLGSAGVLIDPRPAARCGLGSEGDAKPRPYAGERDIPGDREAVRRVDGSDREFLGVVVVVGRAGVEVLV